MCTDERWQPLERAVPLRNQALESLMDSGLSVAARKHLDRQVQGELWMNNIYQVLKVVHEPHEPEEAGGIVLIELSIKRLDGNPARDWRHLQAIKNALAGPEFEAIELFPAESRLVDTANQTFLWCIASREFRFPFGFRERLVIEGSSPGSHQRNFDDPLLRPPDVQSFDPRMYAETLNKRVSEQ